MEAEFTIKLDEKTLRMLSDLIGKSYSEVTRSENSIKYALIDYISIQHNSTKTRLQLPKD